MRDVNDKKTKLLWMAFFDKHRKLGHSLEYIKNTLVSNHNYEPKLIETLSASYIKSKRRKIASYLIAVYLIFLVATVYVFYEKPTITGFPIFEPTYGNEYYINASGGSDSNDGLSPQTAWKTVNKAIGSSRNKGDVFYFACGEIWREPWKYNAGSGNSSHRMYIDSYGHCTGNNNPRFRGTTNESSSTNHWTSINDNKWETPANYSLEVYVMWYDLSQHDENNTKFISRKSSCTSLSQNGDFCWNSSSHKVIMYETRGNPATVYSELEIPIYNSDAVGGSVGGAFATLLSNYVSIRNVDFEYSRFIGLMIYDTSNVELSNVNFRYTYGKALWSELSTNNLYDGVTCTACGYSAKLRNTEGESLWITNERSNVTFINGLIKYMHGVGINMFRGNGVKIINNTIRDCNLNMTHSTITYSAAIYWDQSQNSIAQGNYVENCPLAFSVNAEISGYNASNITFTENIAYDNYLGFISNVNNNVKVLHNINISKNTFVKLRSYTYSGLGQGFNTSIILKYFNSLYFYDNIIADYTSNSYTLELNNYNTFNSNNNIWYSNSGNYKMNVNAAIKTFGQYQSLGLEPDSSNNDPSFTDLNNADLTPIQGSFACAASSTGSYIGAIPCSGSPPSNSPPTHSTPILNASDNPLNSTNATLACYNVSTSDVNGDAVSNNYVWFRNSTSMGSLTSSVVGSGNLSAQDRWVCQVTPYDGTDYGTPKNSSVLTINALVVCGDSVCSSIENCSICSADCGICNSAPAHSNPKLNASDNPANSTNATLNCYNQSTTDSEGNDVTNIYRWFRNSSLVSSLNTSSVAQSQTSISDSWICEIKPFDGLSYGTPKNSSALLIRSACGDAVCYSDESCSTCSADCGICNSAPIHETPVLNASDYPLNSTNATLNCYNQSTSDPDNQSVINNYVWFKNNAAVNGQASSTIPQSLTSIGDSWICQIKPFDGLEYGVAKNTSSLTVRSVCGDNVCYSGESCLSCNVDCGACPVNATDYNISTCVLEDKSWDEDSSLLGAYDLASCFNDPLNQSLDFEVNGNSSIVVAIQVDGVVNLSASNNWYGQEVMYFTARSSERWNSTNNVSLTVAPVADCGDSVCESNLGETCSICAADCGTCSSGGGGGGGGGGGSPTDSKWICGDWSDCVNGRQTQDCTYDDNSSKRTNIRSCSGEVSNSTSTNSSGSNPDVQAPGRVGGGKGTVKPKDENKTGKGSVTKREGLEDNGSVLEGSIVPITGSNKTGLIRYITSKENTGVRITAVSGLIVMIIFAVFIYADSKKA